MLVKRSEIADAEKRKCTSPRVLQQNNSATLSNDPILVFIATVSEHDIEVFDTLWVGTVRAFTSECLLDNRRLPFLDPKNSTLYRVRGLCEHH
jgi:hypothetical protein